VENKGRILVVDDEANARAELAELLSEEGYQVESAGDGLKALGKLEAFGPDLVLTDLKMPGMDGIGLLQEVRVHDPDVVVVVMTAFGGIETAITAMRAGAADYLTKPVNVTELSLVIKREIERRRLRAEANQLHGRLAERYRFDNIIGNSAPMQDVFKVVAQVASSRASVLLSGESGTGKELIAAAIHEKSPRAKKPFVKLHCSALAESLLESELFGHERGSFTGAAGRRDGRFFQADGGTLFLDEIGEISTAIQVKLLRFLQEHAFERVGGNETIHVDVRVVAATNRDLRQLVAEGKFREDLYYRLNVINIVMPPLRERASDVTLLAAHYLAKYAQENGKTITGFSHDTLGRLTGYPWPGNVRELENVIQRATLLCTGNLITVAELPPTLQPSQDKSPIHIPGSSLAEVERYAIMKTLESTGGSTSKAAELLKISVRKIQYKLLEYQEAPHAEVAALAG